MAKETTIKEVGEMLHHVVKHMATKEDISEIRKEMATKEEMNAGFASIRKEMRDGFSVVNRRLDTIIQIQLDQHASRIKKLETVVFPR